MTVDDTCEICDRQEHLFYRHDCGCKGLCYRHVVKHDKQCKGYLESLEFNANYDTADSMVFYRFKVLPETLKPNGWVKCRLVRIRRIIDAGEYSEPDCQDTLYDPAIHDNTSHYMGYLYNARIVISEIDQIGSNDTIVTICVYWERGGIMYATT
jgi:hypothetical protein